MCLSNWYHQPCKRFLSKVLILTVLYSFYVFRKSQITRATSGMLVLLTEDPKRERLSFQLFILASISVFLDT